jgi:hypothetical protein
MTTNHDTHLLSLADLDRVLPSAYEVLPTGDPRNGNPHALRTVRNEAGAQTHSFYSAQEYLTFATSVAPHRWLAEKGGTRYIELSAQYDADPWFHASVTHTVAAFTRASVILHRMKSDETSVRSELSREEMAALVAGYQSYLDDCEQAGGEADTTHDPFLDFPDDLT